MTTNMTPENPGPKKESCSIGTQVEGDECERLRVEIKRWKNRAEEAADAEDEIISNLVYTEDLLVEQEEEKKKWIEAALKFQFLGQKIKDLLPDSEAKDIIDCFDDIEIPEVDEETRREFVVTETIDSVVATSTLAEDREYYGEDFYLAEPEDNPEGSYQSAEGPPPHPDATDPLDDIEKDFALTNLIYELGLADTMVALSRFGITSISQLRGTIQLWNAVGSPFAGDGVSVEAQQVLQEWSQSLNEEESREIHANMGETMDNDQLTYRHFKI